MPNSRRAGTGRAVMGLDGSCGGWCTFLFLGHMDGLRIIKVPWLGSLLRLALATLWNLPAKSPDLNPVEMFWSWLRRKLRAMDLADLRKKRRPLGKTAYTVRVKSVMRTQRAQTVAKGFAKAFRKACRQVVSR